MKKIIFSVLVLIIVLMGTYIVIEKFKSKSTKIQENKTELVESKIKPEDLFQKKKECASYKDKIMGDILTPNLVYDDSDPTLIEIFYSPKRNSCLYIFDYYKSPDCLKMDTDTYFKIGCQFKESQVVDFLTKETVYSSVTYNNCFDRISKNKDADIAICKTISEKADELKK